MQDIILGLDPGSRFTGYGVIGAMGDQVEYKAHGVIQLKAAWPIPERLRVLHHELSAIFAQFKISCAVVEKIFFGKNVDSAFRLGHARGVCLLVAGQSGVRVEEYAARFVKKCITGSGAADKAHVQRMVCALLRINPKDFAFDASDALSLALTKARMGDTNSRLRQQLEGEL